jgi:hypothetical protein
VSEQIRRELADLLRFHLKDQRIAAKMTPRHRFLGRGDADYAHAKVFYTSLADPSANEAIAEGWPARRASAPRTWQSGCESIMYRNCISSSIPRCRKVPACRKLIDAAVESDQKHRDE